MITFTPNFSVLHTEFTPGEVEAASAQDGMPVAFHDSMLVNININLNINIHDQLERVLQSPQAQRTAISDSTATNGSLLSPIQNVFPEVLGEIFQYCTLPHVQQGFYSLHNICSSSDAPLLLLRVCRRWREVAQGTPQLWADVGVYSLKDIPYAATCLRNSGSVPLNLTIAHKCTENDWGIDFRHCHAFAKALGKKLPFVRRLKYYGSFHGLTNLFPSGNPQIYPYLEEILLDCTGISGGDSLPHFEATRLHSLTLRETAVHLISGINPASCLRKLALQMSGLERFPTSQLINFLRLCPGIEELELHSNSIFEEPVNYFEEPIVLSALWKLELDCDYGSGLLGLLRAPNLLSAVLLHAPHDLHVVGTFISDVRRSLIHLSLVDLDFSSAILHDSVKTLVELKRLRLVACRTPEDLWFSLTQDEEGLANCPKLERLEISGTSLGVGFVELVRRRMSASQQGGDGNDEARCLLDVVIENCTIPHSNVTALELLQLEREGLSISGLAGTLDGG